jgi:hypothetical protein
MEVVCSSETSINYNRTTRHLIPEGSTLHANVNEPSDVMKGKKFLHYPKDCLVFKEDFFLTQRKEWRSGCKSARSCNRQGRIYIWGKGLTPGTSDNRTKDLLKLNRDQLRWVVGLFTGHCHLKGHLFKIGLTDDPTCERCLEEDVSAT